MTKPNNILKDLLTIKLGNTDFKCQQLRFDPNSEVFVNQKAFILSTECMSIRGGTNSSMFVNCLVFGEVREVRSSVLAKISCSDMFEVQF